MNWVFNYDKLKEDINKLIEYDPDMSWAQIDTAILEKYGYIYKYYQINQRLQYADKPTPENRRLCILEELRNQLHMNFYQTNTYIFSNKKHLIVKDMLKLYQPNSFSKSCIVNIIRYYNLRFVALCMILCKINTSRGKLPIYIILWITDWLIDQSDRFDLMSDVSKIRIIESLLKIN